MKTNPLDFDIFILLIIGRYLRKIKRHQNGKTHGYWALDEMDASGRLSIQLASENRTDYQADLFDKLEPKWVEVSLNTVRVE